MSGTQLKKTRELLLSLSNLCVGATAVGNDVLVDLRGGGDIIASVSMENGIVIRVAVFGHDNSFCPIEYRIFGKINDAAKHIYAHSITAHSIATRGATATRIATRSATTRW